MSLEQYLETLADDERPLRNEDLMQLSDLTSEDLRLVASAWRDIDAGRRRDVLTRLIQTCPRRIWKRTSATFSGTVWPTRPRR